MILMPCSGGVVAIGPPVVEGRIVAAPDPGAGPWLAILGRWRRHPSTTPSPSSRPRRPSTGRSACRTTGRWQPRPWPAWDARTTSPPWVEQYRRAPRAAPPPADRPLAEQEWPAALGRRTAFPTGRPSSSVSWPTDRPSAVVGEWVPRLLPGTIGAATHGLIRTGARSARPRRRRHPAAAPRGGDRSRLVGLDLPGAARAPVAHRPPGRGRGPRRPAVPARGRAPRLADQRHGGATWPKSPTSSNRRWPRSAGPARSVELLDELASGGALAYLRNADDGGAIGLLHSVTSPLACELLLPWLADEDRDAALGYVWQAVAALHVGYDVDRHERGGSRRRPLAPTPSSIWRSPRATSTPSS